MSIKITLKELKISWQYEEFWLNVEFSDEILYLRSISDDVTARLTEVSDDVWHSLAGKHF